MLEQMIYRSKKAIHQAGEAAYRIRVGGIGQFLRDVHEVLESKRVSDQHQLTCGCESSRARLRLLYVHSGWAIYNVGLCWFQSSEYISCTMVRVEDYLARPEQQSEYDLILFGYAYLLQRCQHIQSQRPYIVAIHDPIELFEETPGWESTEPYAHVLDLCRQADGVLCLSKEMQHWLGVYGIDARQIPSAPLIPSKGASLCRRISERSLVAITIGRIYRRKRFEVFNEIARVSAHRGMNIEFRAKWDRAPLPESDYIAYLDGADVYIVTSSQEGGPLPAMDAMRRGLVVLSTPVGQMREIIENGESGFICNNTEDFLKCLRVLSEDRSRLEMMKQNSLDRILQLRSSRVIQAAVSKAFSDFLHPSDPA